VRPCRSPVTLPAARVSCTNIPESGMMEAPDGERTRDRDQQCRLFSAWLRLRARRYAAALRAGQDRSVERGDRHRLGPPARRRWRADRRWPRRYSRDEILGPPVAKPACRAQPLCGEVAPLDADARRTWRDAG